MGHVRLGTLPRTRQWSRVLDLVGGGAGAPRVAAATMEASLGGLADAATDPGLVHAVWLLTQVPLAARGDDFTGRLRTLGLDVGKSPTVLEVVGAFSAAVDAHVARKRNRTDVGEMAQMAAAEALTAFATPANASLFDLTPKAEQAIRGLSTVKEFSALSREFFARFTRKYLTYFLSRELSNYVSGDGRFTNLQQHAAFNADLDVFCRQASRIVEEFSGGWYSKTEFKGGITQANASRFVHIAVKKLSAELSRGQRAVA